MNYFTESAKFRALRAVVPYVPYALRTLWLTCYRASRVSCPTSLVPYVIVPHVCRALCALVHYVPRLALRASCPACFRSLRASCATCSRVSRAFCPAYSRASRALCFTYLVPYVALCLALYELFFLTYPIASYLAHSMR